MDQFNRFVAKTKLKLAESLKTKREEFFSFWFCLKLEFSSLHIITEQILNEKQNSKKRTNIYHIFKAHNLIIITSRQDFLASGSQEQSMLELCNVTSLNINKRRASFKNTSITQMLQCHYMSIEKKLIYFKKSLYYPVSPDLSNHLLQKGRVVYCWLICLNNFLAPACFKGTGPTSKSFI